MKMMGRQAAVWLGIMVSFWAAGCGGSGGSNNQSQRQKATPTVTVTPALGAVTTVQSLQVTVTVTGTSGTPTGSVILASGNYTSSATTLAGGNASITIPAGSLAANMDPLTASYTPDAASSSTYNGSSGAGQVTVTKATPMVTVLPALPSITTTQSDAVTVTVNGGTGAPTATGAVTLASVRYTSAATMLANGSAQIVIPAGVLGVGNDGLTATYAPDTPSSAIYNGAGGLSSVTVNLIVPAVTVTPSSSSITANQPLTVTVGVSGGSGNPTATGSVTLGGGGYTSSATTLTNGSAQINIPASLLTTGSDSLMATYTPDATSSSIYAGATGTGQVTVNAPVAYVLTIDSAAPSSGISITVSPIDNNGAGLGTTPFTRSYYSGTLVTLTAGLTANTYGFVSWSGCNSTSGTSGSVCNVTISGATTVTANYNQTGISSITVTPSTATIGTQQQFTATVHGTGSYSSGVTWSLTCSSCGSLSPGTLSASGLYTTPYPAPSSVTITATSTMSGFTNVSGSATVTLNPPATASGPALAVDVGTPGNPISPDIYGMDAYLLHGTAADTAAVAPTNITIDRWGGDSTERYNYQLDVTNSIDDWYFENQTGTGGDGWPTISGVKAFDALVESNNSNGIKTLGTVPVLGWVAKDSTSCSYPEATYPNQLAVNGKAAFDTYRECGSGVYPNGVSGCTNSSGCNIPSDPTVTSVSEPPPPPPAASAVTTSWAENTWAGGWTEYLVNKFGAGNSGTGVAIYDLDNEPTWWDSNDFDVHPLAFTYDEVTNGGIGTALAIKTVDPTAQVGGPVIDYWWAYFYSKKDIESGWDSGSPCYRPWSNPVDREAHGGVPLIEYYLKQFAAAQATYGIRLLDYVDLHTYFAAQYPANSGNGLGLNPAGDTGAQQARLNSTRAFWDPTYTDSSTNNGGGYPQPNYPTDPNYTGATNCNPPQQAPQLIRMMKTWVANDYPGTKTAIDEYNFGGMEAINGALTQADILGIFGREGLDLGTMWPTEDPSEQIPGMMAFAIYRNYDGNKSTFGDTVLPSTSTASGADAEGQLAVYGAQRTKDSAITIMVINKTYGALTSTISLENFSALSGTKAQVYQYSNANLNAIVQEAGVSVTPPTGSGTTSTISNYTFPAQSITLFVVPY
ncbi:MAG: glycoside hydrolase family 44 protein [Terracidiphilus sp.]